MEYVVRALQYLSFSVLPLFEVIVAAALLRLTASGVLRQRWWIICALSVPVLAAAPILTFMLFMQLYPAPKLIEILAAALIMAVITCLLLALIVRWQIGGLVNRFPIWLGVIAAELSFFFKLGSDGWLSIAELVTGVYFAVPIIHVLVRLVTSAGSRSRRLAAASVVSDIVIVATTLLRLERGDSPTWVTFEAMFYDRYTLPSWLQWANTPESFAYNYNFLLYLPVVACWAICLFLVWRKRRSISPQAPAEMRLS